MVVWLHPNPSTKLALPTDALNTLKAKGEELKEGKEECSTKIHNRFMPF
jgi:hypothetical protein